MELVTTVVDVTVSVSVLVLRLVLDTPVSAAKNNSMARRVQTPMRMLSLFPFTVRDPGVWDAPCN